MLRSKTPYPQIVETTHVRIENSPRVPLVSAS
jgi:hypothetical protein